MPDTAALNRKEFLDFADQLLHRSLLLIEPHPQSGEHRRRLLNLVNARRKEMQALGRSKSSESIATAIIDHISTRSLADSDEHARFLGLPTYLDHATALREKAASLGIQVSEHEWDRVLKGGEDATAIPPSAGKQNLTASRRKRQEDLLEEGLNETFPASDPISVSIVN
jgi:hypothetical protein